MTDLDLGITVPDTPVTPVATPAATPAEAHWYDTLEPEFRGHVQAKGWDKLAPDAAAVAMARAHREAEKHIGVPTDQLLRIPRPDASEADQKAFWAKLGAPADAAGYKFDDVKWASGETVEPELVEYVRNVAADLHLPADAAQKLAKHLVTFAERDETETAARDAANLAVQKDQLLTNWGERANTNLEVARRGASKLGFTQEEINSLEQFAGYARVMEAFRQIGVASGEAKFFEGELGGGGEGQTMTRDQAIARIESLKTDREWGKKWMAGGAAEAREWEDLHRVATGRMR